MSHNEAQASPASAQGSPFSPSETAVLHEDDRKAARNIVVLMLGIFLTGLAGYIAIAVWVSQR